jgi:hypothetical protein
MNKLFAILAATTILASTVPAFAVEESQESKTKTEYKKDGGYDSTTTSSSTNTNGTANTAQSSTNVSVDSKGYVEKTTKSENTSDPKGLMNKEKDTSETTLDEKPRGGYKQVTMRKHLDANGTNIVYTTTTDVDVDANGNVTTTALTEKTVNPKGLMNETTTKTRSKSINGKMIEDSKKVN